MNLEFTPGAQRAMLAATTWTSDSVHAGGPLGVAELLLGLLAEPECRAALLLAEVGVDLDVARRRFAALSSDAPPNRQRLEDVSQAWNECLLAAHDLLIDYPRPLALATEHLLLGIVAADNEVSRWLRQQGLSPEELEAEVHRLSGYEPGPLPLDVDEPEIAEGHSEPLDVAIAIDETVEPPRHELTGALRAFDAAANRAEEGLRVVEDYLRFVLDDRHLTGECKSLRHELAAALRMVAAADRQSARDTQGDVGTEISLPSERRRADTADVAHANLKRVQQALRSMEEFSKVFAPAAASRLEALRYRAYTLERAIGITAGAIERLAGARLYVLIDGGPSVEAFCRLAESLVSAQVGMIQLRDKRLSDRLLLERARLLADITRQGQTLFVMNDRPDLAVLAGADGVHVGQEELSVKDARRILGPRGLVGVSIHSLEQARAAVLEGASYIGVGPTFPSPTKHFAQFAGTSLLAEVAQEIRLPAFAIGGINLDNVADVLATGITRVAVAGAIVGAVDPAGAARSFREELGEA